MSEEPVRLELPLIIGVSTRAMFDLAEEHAVFEREGVKAYAKLQRERENDPLRPGAAFEVTKRLLALNPTVGKPLVDVILLSKHSPDLSLRAFKALDQHQIPIGRGSLTSGRSVAQFVRAWKIDLFLSNDEDDVRAAHAGGTAAARLGARPDLTSDAPAMRSVSRLTAMRSSSAMTQTAFSKSGALRAFLSTSD